MIVWWLILLSVLTYVVIRKSVAQITSTPVWLLWLVMMAPVLLWLGWIALFKDAIPIPMPLLLGSFLVCPLIYLTLIQMGRQSPIKPVPPSLTVSSKSVTSMDPSNESLTPDSVANSSTKRTIGKEDEDILKRCFPWSVYYLKGIEHRAQALICTGHLRTSSDVAYQTISDNIRQNFGQRFLVIFQQGLNGKPFFALVPNPQANPNAARSRNLYPVAISIALLAATALTTTIAGAMLASQELEAPLRLTWSNISLGVPYCLALIAILLTYHGCQYVISNRHGLRASLPYFIPVPPLVLGFPFGTFGAFLQMRSPMPNRKVLFDMGFVGSIAGIVMAIPILLWGLAHSEAIPATDESSLFNIQSFDPKASFLIAMLGKLAIHDLSTTQALNLHPVAIAACLGLLIITINLMPVGQLNGGKIVHAMFGQRTGAIIGQVARLLVLLLAYIHRNQREFWILAILFFFMPSVDEPALNDVSELDNQRDLWGVVALAILTIIILPAPPLLTNFLF
ncbi:MAG: site-2 protease family protein [Cyanobacteria bacterium P01_F01_bin.150]